MSLAIDIAVKHEAWIAIDGVNELVENAADAALMESGKAVVDGTELSVALCDDAFLRTLNRDWRQKDRPTNVLSFPADRSARHVTLGDIAVAYETTAREASDEGKDIGDHLAHLIVHGVLHLLGYDHENDAEAAIMERLEVRALTRLGLAAPYEEIAPLRTPG